MAHVNPNVDDLILSIHSAALDPDGWSRVGLELLSLVSAHSGIGLRVPSQAHPEPWAVLIDFDPDAAREYAEHWGRQDLWYHGAVRTRRISTGMVSTGTQLADTAELKSSAFYNDFLKALDIGPMIQVCLAGSEPGGDFGQAALSLYRGIGQSAFSAGDVEILSVLAPHLTVAAKNYWMAQSMRLQARARANALDAVNSAVFAINRTHRLLFANFLGEEWLRQGKWVNVTNGALTPSPYVRPRTRFTAELLRAATGVGSTFLTTDSLTRDEAQVSITPIPVDLELGVPVTTPVSLIWITPTAIRNDTARDMALVFGLTPAEHRILAHMIAGSDLREAAVALHVSIHTARAQLKSILRKTGRRSQGQLLLLAGRLATLSSTQT